MWFVRMARWARHPPSWQRVVLVVAVVTVGIALASFEWIWGWPEWLKVNGPARLRVKP